MQKQSSMGFAKLALAMALVVPAFQATADTVTWTNAVGLGGVGATMDWSNPANWTNQLGVNVVPGAADDVQFRASEFGNIGTTNVPGAINSILTTDLELLSLQFFSYSPGYHGIQMNPGITLTVGPFATTTEPFSYRNGYTPPTNAVGITTIKGAASIVVGNPASPSAATTHIMRVHATSTHPGATTIATLDMSELNNFSIGVGSIKIGASGSGSATRGRLILAKTNLLVSAITTTTVDGFILGQTTTASAGDYSSYGELQLGRVNEIRAGSMKIGSGRSSGSLMAFQSFTNNSTLVMRGVNGFDAVPFIGIGDNNDGPNALNINTNAIGVIDLTGGTVDALVTSMRVGRNVSFSGGTSSLRTGSGNGTLTWTAGTINVGSVHVGRQANDNAGSVTGVVNVRSNALFVVTGSISIGRDAGAAAGTGNGTLNVVYGGTAAVTNNIVEDVVAATVAGTSRVNLTNGTLAVGGIVRVDNLSAENSALSLNISPATTAANPVCDVTNLTLLGAVTLNVSGSSVTLASYPLIKYKGTIGGAGFAALTLGTQPTDTFGYLFNNTANKTIDLVVTNVPAAKWNGNVNGNWDITGTTNWINSINSAATTYNENSIPGDPVIFDDTATGTKTVNLTTLLSPALIIVNNNTPYTFIGSGNIAGTATLTKSGSGTLEIANGALNDYTGATTISGGTLRVNGAIQNSSVTIQSGGTLSGTGVISAPISIASGGTLSVGNGVGTLSVNNNLTLAAGSTNIFEVNTDTLVSDQVMMGGGTVTFGGNLVLNVSGTGTALTNGAAIQLFNPWSFTGSFASISPVYPALGFYWDTSTLNADGALRITAIPASTTVIWTNATGGNLLWSNPANWIRTNELYAGSHAYNTVPDASDWVYFATTHLDASTATNVVGAVNNIVDMDMTMGRMLYSVQEPGYHTMQINPGVTLGFTNVFPGAGDPFSYRASRDESSITGYVTIKGQGKLIVGDLNNPHPSPGNQIRIHSVASPLVPGGNPGANTNGPFMATMDMKDLDYFASATGEIKIGASATSGRGTRGTMILAKTNLLICGVTSDNFYGLIMGGSTGGDYQPGGSIGHLQLGQENEIRAFAIRVGGPRAQLGTMKFRSGLVNPTVKMRHTDGVSAVSLLSVGDNAQTGSSAAVNSTVETSTGDLDLTGGTADILVQSLRIGRNINSSTTTFNGSGNGTMTWTAGTVQSTGTSDIGRHLGNNLGICVGVINVRSNAVWLGQDIRLGRDGGSAGGTGSGTVNIAYGGVVDMPVSPLSIFEDIAGSGTSTINVTNGYLSTGGEIVVDNVNVISGVISNAGPLTAGRVTGGGVISGPVTVTNLLSPGASIGTLTIYNSLTIGSTATNVFEVNTDTLAHDRVAGLTSVTYGGTLVVLPSGFGSAITNGASAKIFDAASYSGSFAAIVPATPAPGFVWNTSQLAINGTISIDATVSTTPTNLVYAMVGNALNISWPASHTGWRLQAQTNSINVGLSNNWVTVAGSTTTNQVFMPVNPANGAVFYRLIFP